MCFRARETHDLETTQQDLRVAGSSCRSSTMRSIISGGGGHDMIVVGARETSRYIPVDAGREYPSRARPGPRPRNARQTRFRASDRQEQNTPSRLRFPTFYCRGS